MISGTTGPSGAIGKNGTDGDALGNALGKQVMGKDDFLRILVSQLRNQDPMSPMEGTEFATQLAQFSTVEQLTQMSKKMDEQMASQVAAQDAMQYTAATTLGASLVGQNVLVDGSTLSVDDIHQAQVTVDVPGGVSDLTIKVKGKGGEQEFKFNAVAAGRKTFTLDDLDLPPGDYSYQVDAHDIKGKTVATHSYSAARVDGMSFADGELQVRVGGSLIPMSKIIEVRAPAPLAPTTTATKPGATAA